MLKLVSGKKPTCDCGLESVEKEVMDRSKESFGWKYLGCANFPHGCGYFRWLNGKSPKSKKGKANSSPDSKKGNDCSVERNVKKRKLVPDEAAPKKMIKGNK